MSNTLKARLKSNMNIVLILFIIASIFSIIRMFNLINDDTFQINAVFTDKHNIAILIQGFGFLAIVASSMLYRLHDKLSETQQVVLCSFLGIAFMPYTIILYVIGIMMFVEDNRYKLYFFIPSILGMIAFGLAFSIIFI